MYRRDQLPTGHQLLRDLSDFGRVVRCEGKAVLLETAGELLGYGSKLATDVAVGLGERGRDLRAAASEVAPVRPPEIMHLHLAPLVSEEEADEAARLETMRRHPAGKGLPQEDIG